VHKQLSEMEWKNGRFVANACPISEFIKDSSWGGGSPGTFAQTRRTESKWSLNASC